MTAKNKEQTDQFVQACLEANKEVYAVLHNAFTDKMLQKRSIGAGGDISSEADIIAEEIFVKYLHKFGTIESEESGIIGMDCCSKIIIDPLDGSANFASGFPYYGTSAALIDNDGILRSAQICNMANGDIFIKDYDGNIIIKNIFNSLYTVKPRMSTKEIGIFEKAYAYPKIVDQLLQNGYKFRSPGATALSLAYAKTVSFFLFAGRSRIYDIAAGLAFCEGMEVIVEEDYVIVSQNKTVAQDIEKIVHRSIG